MRSDVDRRLFGVPNPGLTRREVVMAYLEYADAAVASQDPSTLAGDDDDTAGMCSRSTRGVLVSVRCDEWIVQVQKAVC